MCHVCHLIHLLVSYDCIQSMKIEDVTVTTSQLFTSPFICYNSAVGSECEASVQQTIDFELQDVPSPTDVLKNDMTDAC